MYMILNFISYTLHETVQVFHISKMRFWRKRNVDFVTFFFVYISQCSSAKVLVFQFVN